MELKTKYKRIYFNDVSARFPKRKTKTYYCHTQTGVNLGTVKWYSQWRQYCFFPLFDQWAILIFSGGCSIDIGTFCSQLNEQRKQERKDR